MKLVFDNGQCNGHIVAILECVKASEAETRFHRMWAKADGWKDVDENITYAAAFAAWLESVDIIEG